MTNTLPDDFLETIPRIFGDAGREWLLRLPDILEQCIARWQLTIVPPAFAQLSVNYLAYATTPAGEEVVLKIGVALCEVEAEATALRFYGGRGMVACVDADLSLGAMLLARLRPGYMLTSLPGNAAQTRVAARLMKTLPSPCPDGHNLPAFADWLTRAFARLRRERGPGCGPLGCALVEQAERAFRAIQADGAPHVLLHGDLHHENILYDERRGWTAIDPKGALGDAALEAGRFLNNQLSETLPLSEQERLIEERVDILSAELGLPRDKILRCTFVDKILSLAWSLEDSYVGPDWESSMAIARLLSGKVDVT